MTSELESAARAYRRAGKALDRHRSRLADAIVASDRAGVRQHVIVEITGYTRERIRQIIRAAEDEG